MEALATVLATVLVTSHTHGVVLDALLASNVTDRSDAESLCATGALAYADAKAADAAFKAAAPRTNASVLATGLSGCYFICILGRKVRPIPSVLSKVPWNGKCFDGNHTIVNRFGPAGDACRGFNALKAWYGYGDSKADPGRGGAVVIRYSPEPMRDELRDAGDAPGCASLHDTWVSKFFLAGQQVADFALLPVRCDRRDEQ